MPTTDPFHSLVLMNAVFASAAWCLAKPSWSAAISLSVASVLWLFFNAPIEGAVLYVVDADRGLTESDFLTLAGVILAGVTVARVRRGRQSDVDS
ncbi:hypothetical protein [Rhodococcus sp. 14-2483-1-2]|uniref:hypothetical protein n=1 Tax=Rhodococcus sp. 14-2483-1-2 TaxID=2023147 RepID=UPI000B9A23AD|nr:hypothetical protein [Rhodococcus sp. 14-2483-1-2]OZF37345.1 hypothetical protein CH295_06690 [Rhodococcus sp. 14-2483-1-2]